MERSDTYARYFGYLFNCIYHIFRSINYYVTLLSRSFDINEITLESILKKGVFHLLK